MARATLPSCHIWVLFITVMCCMSEKLLLIRIISGDNFIIVCIVYSIVYI